MLDRLTDKDAVSARHLSPETCASRIAACPYQKVHLVAYQRSERRARRRFVVSVGRSRRRRARRPCRCQKEATIERVATVATFTEVRRLACCR
jgi:hypothetical protein